MGVVSVFALTLAYTMFVVAPICAQTRAATPRDTRPLFGGGAGNADQLLTLAVDFSSGYDNNVLRADAAPAEDVASLNLHQSQSSVFEHVSGNLDYKLNRSRLSFAANVASAAVHYPIFDSSLTWSHGASSTLALPLWSGARAMATETISSQPYYSYFPSLSSPSSSFEAQAGPLFDPALASALPDQKVSALGESHLTTGTAVGLNQRLSRHFDLSLVGNDDRSQSASHARDVTTQGASGHIAGPIARGISLRFGYEYSHSRYEQETGSRTFRRRSVDAGLSFDRALSLSRRTTLSFGSGSSSFVESGQTHFFITGNGGLHRDIGRTWTADFTYNRGVQFVEGFHRPVASDSLGFRMGGLLTRQLSFHSSVMAATGHVGLANRDNRFVSYQASSGVSAPLSRRLAVTVDYAYVHYRFGMATELTSELLQHADRHRVSVTASLREPLFRRRGRDASR